ncbi:hypothetical protein JYU34_019934 [Plutella xylostella]|uniref:Uncharacterized protein n=1 Tax=Plutella xylostella TaxID=51655 RepID=A0ABQ7PZC8_PLUXY|nr:hypothetical protein JYU34_019934 [Plutella xylostella]
MLLHYIVSCAKLSTKMRCLATPLLAQSGFVYSLAEDNSDWILRTRIIKDLDVTVASDTIQYGLKTLLS